MRFKFREHDEVGELMADSNLNNHEIGKRKKKDKRKSDHSDADVEIQKVREQDMVGEKDGNEQEMLEKNTRQKVDSAENEAGERMGRATDGKKDKKKRKKQKGEKGISDTEDLSCKIDGKAVGSGREVLVENFMEKVAKDGGGTDSTEKEAGKGMPRAKGGKEDEKKRKKRKRERDVGDTGVISGGIDGKEAGNERSSLGENILENVEPSRKKKKQKRELGSEEMEDLTAAANRSNEVEKKKKKKKVGGTEHKLGDEVVDASVMSGGIDGKEARNERLLLGEYILENVEPSRKKKKKKQKRELGSEEMEDLTAAANRSDEVEKKKKKKKKVGGSEHKLGDEVTDASVISGGIDGKEARNERLLLGENILENLEPSRKKKKKKKQKRELGSEEMKDLTAAANRSDEIEKKKKKKKKGGGSEHKLGDEVTDASVRSKSKEASKRVSFSEDVEIFPSSDDPSDGESVQKGELVRGKRFSQEEDEMVKEAVLNYIDQRGLGEEGLNMVLKCKKYPQVRNCWKEIAQALPWRPCESVYHRAHVLFERDEAHKWTEEEYELVRKFHEKYGPDWRTLGDALGKHRFHVKDAWRRINVANRNTGQWSQDEYQSLFDLVNMDLRMKAFEERKSKHGMLRDNIAWTAISNKLGSRATPLCCMKWYDTLTSPLVSEGKWADVDDYRLLMALYDVDACCMEDVEWDGILEHRPGDVCRKRWNQMVKHLGEAKNGSFAEQVEVLIKRYCPDVLEAREAYASKPIVD